MFKGHLGINLGGLISVLDGAPLENRLHRIAN